MKTAKSLVIMLIISLLSAQLFRAHLHIYDHQHGYDGHETHQAISHSGLDRSEPEHHGETTTIEVAQPFIAKILKFQPSIGFVFFACLLFLLFPQSRTLTVRPAKDPFWLRRYLLPPPARAPPCC